MESFTKEKRKWNRPFYNLNLSVWYCKLAKNYENVFSNTSTDISEIDLHFGESFKV